MTVTQDVIPDLRTAADELSKSEIEYYREVAELLNAVADGIEQGGYILPTRIELEDRKDQALLDFIREYVTLHPYPPTVRDICAWNGASTSVVNYRLRKLQSVGAIHMDKNTSRGIKLL